MAERHEKSQAIACPHIPLLEIVPPIPHDGSILDVSHGKNVYFHSYRFAQGKQDLHKLLFEYLGAIRPGWRMTNNLRRGIFFAIRKPIRDCVIPREQTLKNGTPRPLIHREIQNTDFDAKYVYTEILLFLDEMQAKLNASDRRPKPFIVEDITRKIATYDLEYLTKTDSEDNIVGRPRKNIPSGSRSPSTDPFLSHLCYYGLEGRSTGIEEYDSMFTDVSDLVRQNVRSGIWTPTSYPNLFETINTYQHRHPDSIIPL